MCVCVYVCIYVKREREIFCNGVSKQFFFGGVFPGVHSNYQSNTMTAGGGSVSGGSLGGGASMGGGGFSSSTMQSSYNYAVKTVSSSHDSHPSGIFCYWSLVNPFLCFSFAVFSF